MAVPAAVLVSAIASATAGSTLLMSEVTVPDATQDPGALTGSVTVGADGALAYDTASFEVGPTQPGVPIEKNCFSGLAMWCPSCHTHVAAVIVAQLCVECVWLQTTLIDASLWYANSYTISGCCRRCEITAFCGVYVRVPAHCTETAYQRCPGGSMANGYANATLCDGAPTYQQRGGEGYVLFRAFDSDLWGDGIGTRWMLTDGEWALETCSWHTTPRSRLNLGRLGLPPSAQGYAEAWTNFPHYTGVFPLIVTAGGGR